MWHHFDSRQYDRSDKGSVFVMFGYAGMWRSICETQPFQMNIWEYNKHKHNNYSWKQRFPIVATTWTQKDCIFFKAHIS